MKYIISILLMLSFSVKSFSQDSSKIVVSIPIAYKDVKFISYFIYNNDAIFGDLRDSINAKHRQGADPDENSASTLSAEIGTWLRLLQMFRMNVDALKSKTFDRIDASLKLLVQQTYLISELIKQDGLDVISYQAVRQGGNKNIKRQQQQQ